MTKLESRGISAGRQLRGEIPFLRRFARAVTGDQEVADRSVIHVMERLISEPRLLEGFGNPRVGLYQTLLLGLEKEAVAAIGSTPTRLATPSSRQGYLLTAIEGFSEDAAAEVLSVSRPEFRRLLEVAKSEISQQIKSNILIIEDEALIAVDLEAIVTQIGHLVTGNARTHNEAIQKFGIKQPDLILSDVQLADGSSGIDFVDGIHASTDIPVVFITAYPERLLTGKRGEPAFLITKPFDAATVKATISQALYLRDHRVKATPAYAPY